MKKPKKKKTSTLGRALNVPENAKDLALLIKGNEGLRLEFKKSTGELKEGLQTLCAFLNGKGGVVLFGVNRKGVIEGQQVSEQTIHEITAALTRFEPPAPVEIERIKVGRGLEVIVLVAKENFDPVPYTFDGRAFERVGNTTRKMSQNRYESLLFQRAHAKRRWENELADDVTLKELDREEILRTRESAIERRRISAGTSRNIGDILDRLGLRVKGVLTNAAQVLYGTNFLNNYPQCHLKMGRFRGAEITGEIIDNKQEYMHAFAMVREGMAFLDKTLPLGAKFPEGKIFREDRLAVPANALREVLLNAVMHRDYSNYMEHVAIVVFDNRVEIRSPGTLPKGVTVDQLSGPHLSELRNPFIANTFHRTGAVEIWGRGTNRVFAECKRYGIKPPTFEERQGYLIVTFWAQIGPQTTPQVTAEVTAQVTAEVTAQVVAFCQVPRSAKEIMATLGLKHWKTFQTNYLLPLIGMGVLERTIPDKPTSRLQKYRATGKAF